MKKVFTTGEAAEICKISQQTIIRCFDTGKLKGFLVPGSKFRRIPRDALIAFMKNNNIPNDVLNNLKTKVLVVTSEIAVQSLFESARSNDVDIEIAKDTFTAGMKAEAFEPDLIIAHDGVENVDSLTLCRGVRQQDKFNETRVVIISDNLTESLIRQHRSAGATATTGVPANPDDVIAGHVNTREPQAA